MEKLPGDNGRDAQASPQPFQHEQQDGELDSSLCSPLPPPLVDIAQRTKLVQYVLRNRGGFGLECPIGRRLGDVSQEPVSQPFRNLGL